jgi:hypothetical protein
MHRQCSKKTDKRMENKEMIVSSERVNTYGSRVITAGIDLSQYEKNPVLLYMHRRYSDSMPIGRVENLRVEGVKLIGTPVFDIEDEFAKKIAGKWDRGFLRMCSPYFDILETSNAPELVLQGQTRETITRCKLVEISIVDIGGNDDALQLCRSGKVLELSSGAACDGLPLLKAEIEPEIENINNQKSNQMKNILLALGLLETATDEQAVAAIKSLQLKAEKVDSIELSAITGAVDAAITAKKITADQKDHFVALGKSAGVESLNKTLELMKVASKPTDMINPNSDEKPAETIALKWADLTPEVATKMKTEDPKQYIALFKENYGFEPELS